MISNVLLSFPCEFVFTPKKRKKKKKGVAPDTEYVWIRSFGVKCSSLVETRHFADVCVYPGMSSVQ